MLREVLVLLCVELEERALELVEDDFDVFTEVEEDDFGAELRIVEFDELFASALRELVVERLVLLCAGLEEL